VPRLVLVVVPGFSSKTSTRANDDFFMPRCGATLDENVEGARVSADTRAAILLADRTFPGRRWDSASHIQQAIFRGAFYTNDPYSSTYRWADRCHEKSRFIPFLTNSRQRAGVR